MTLKQRKGQALKIWYQRLSREELEQTQFNEAVIGDDYFIINPEGDIECIFLDTKFFGKNFKIKE